MTASATLPKFISHGHVIPAEHTGILRDSTDAIGNVTELRRRIAEDGYLFLPGYLHRAEVIEARREMTRRLAERGLLDPNRDPMEAIVAPEARTSFMPELAEKNAELHEVVYGRRMMQFWDEFFGEPARHFDFTWVRAKSRGPGTPSHIDVVYMGRGTTNLYTAWVPISDVTFDIGGLMILEGSHKHERLRATYGKLDVDAYCSNRPGSKDAWAKGYSGLLSKNPAQIQHAIGGRWLSSEYRMGDMLIFTVFTIHSSLDNHTDEIRLSSDTRYQPASEPADERWIGENPIAHGQAGKRGKIC